MSRSKRKKSWTDDPLVFGVIVLTGIVGFGKLMVWFAEHQNQSQIKIQTVVRR